MKFLLLICLSGLFVLGYSQPTQIAKGKVFDDLNKNGLPDKGERGVSGVLVSNGKEVVKTSSDGFYQISVENPSIIFITKPAGFKVPLNKKNVPQFFYTYYPGGSPKLDYPAINPTGALPKEINFPLIKDKEKKNFKMLVFGDPQVANSTELEYFREDVLSPALNQNFDFAISLGDIVHEDMNLYPEFISSMAMLGKPFYNVAGNHDANYDVLGNNYYDSFRSFFGPDYYSFDYGDVHFIVLENIERFCKKGDVPSYWDCYRGKIGERQLAWLGNDLEYVPPDKMVVLCQHINFEKNKKAGEREKVGNTQEVFNVLKSRENVLVLAGHKHMLQHDYFDQNDGWPGKNVLHQIICASACGSWWTGPKDDRGIPTTTQTDGVPNGYFILDFNGGKMVPTFFPAGNIEEQMRIESPTGKIGEDTKEIIVNVYDANKYSVVTAEIDGGKTIELKNDPRKDPFVAQSFKTYRSDYKSWASPSVSTQMWVALMPGGLGKGFHSIKVTEKDEFNRIYSSYAVFEVE
jgi:3',5'-cyclic AMP phosphodiesterase CpdA